MNDLILITVSAIGGGIVGFFTCAALTAGKVADLHADLFTVRDANDANIAHKVRYSHEAADAQEAHTRCADALAAKNDRIDRALAAGAVHSGR